MIMDVHFSFTIKDLVAAKSNDYESTTSVLLGNLKMRSEEIGFSKVKIYESGKIADIFCDPLKIKEKKRLVQIHGP